VLRMGGEQTETLWDALLPSEVRELPEDLARLDVLLRDAALLRPIAAHWERERPAAIERGCPSVPMSTYVRLMVVKQRTGWGYETLVREVSDSLHLRRFCLIGLEGRVPEESTVRKLTRRLGPETVNAMTRALIWKATRPASGRGRCASTPP
jgi:IS5 family transposase